MMIGKYERQQSVRELVSNGEARTQAYLLGALRDRGIVVDQSTLSRDLMELGARKSGGRYMLLNGTSGGVAELNVAAAVRRFTTCGPNLVVLFTGVGQAQLVAVAVEEQQDPSIVGTVGGDDTIFIATRNQRTQSVALRRLTQWFGDKHER